MSTVVTDVPTASHYEVTVDGVRAGWAAYRQRGDVVVFRHTEIDAAFKGQGVGSVLARGALDEVRSRGLRVAPLCPFIRGWVDLHPDYQDLVEEHS